MTAPKRLDFIDLARGVAVVLMVLWHTADSWIVAGARVGANWKTLVYLGGMAAPLFTSLAGVAVGLRAYRTFMKPSGMSWEVLRGQVGRGLELVVLGYALRMQMWTVDGGGFREAWGVLVWAPGIAGIFACLAACKRLEQKPRQALALFGAGITLYTVALLVLRAYLPERPLGLLRIDVLQCIGASLVLLALSDRVLRDRLWLCVLCAYGILLVTPQVETMLPGILPTPIAGYIARWPIPPTERAMAGFPLLPWLAYGLIGRSVGLVIARQAAANQLARMQHVMLIAGLVVSVASNETIQSMLGTLTHAPWLVYVIRATARFGNLLAMLGLAGLAARSEKLRTSFVHVLGQSSLFAYWVHMEFAYGVSAKSLKQALSIPQWSLGFALLTAAVTLLIYIKRHPRVDGWLDRGEALLQGT